MSWSDSLSETGGGGHSLQGARDLGSGGARHRGRVGVGDVLGRLVNGVVLERRGLLRLRHRSGKRRRVADFDLGRLRHRRRERRRGTAVLGCTMMYCDTLQEPKCLEYN